MVAQNKALNRPLKSFEGSLDNVLQFQGDFQHRVEEVGMGGDFSFVLHENPAPSHIDLTDVTEKQLWQASADRWTSETSYTTPWTAPKS